jgi:cytidyltransferase-like protein
MGDKKVLVSGCYDLLHAGHIAFFKSAAAYGKLYVGVGSDKNIHTLKNHATYFSEEERVYILNSIKYIEKAFVNTDTGMLDFETELRSGKYDIFLVNSDGHTPEKEKLCKESGIEYIVLERIPEMGLPPRSSSETKRDLRFPFRVCLAGGWIDQPWVSKIHPGAVVVAQLWPTIDFNDRSGMATSSRKVAIEIWGDKYPPGDPIRNAKLLFGAENPPGSKYISGSQDHLGLLAPGINRLFYDGGFWPSQISSCIEPDICDWLSNVMYMVPLEPRPLGYDPLLNKNLKKDYIKILGEAGEKCWQGILAKDIYKFGAGISETFEMWKKILPYTVPDYVVEEMKKYCDYPGAITSGSGGGYIVVASENPVEGAIKVKVRY